MPRSSWNVRWVAAVFLACGLLLAVFASLGTARAQQKTPIIIGMATAKSGWLVPYEVPADRFIKFAVDDVNKRGGANGHPLKIITADMKSDRALGAAVAKDLISRGAQILVVSCDYNAGGPAAFVGAQKGLLTVSQCGESPRLGRAIGPTVFTFGTSTSVQAAASAEFAYFTKRWRTAYMLLDNTLEYTNTLCKYFEYRWKQLAPKGLLGKTTFAQSDRSIATQITRIRALDNDPDFIYLCSYPPGGASAVRQMRAAGIDSPIITTHSFTSPTWLKTVPRLTNFYTSAYVWMYGKRPRYSTDPTVNALLKRYVKQFGSLPATASALTGYVLVQDVVRAIARTKGKTGGAALARALESMPSAPTLVLSTQFKRSVHISVNRPEVIMVANGKNGWRYVKTVKPRKVPPLSVGG